MAVDDPAQERGTLNEVVRVFRILFIERRLPGSLYQLYYNLFHKLGIRTASVKTKNGLVVRGFTNSMVMFYEVWSKQDYDVEGVSLGPSMVVVDIGANQGFFSLYAASQGAEVFAFEPCAETFTMLQENVMQNGLHDRVHRFNQAVSGSAGRVNLYIGLDTSGHLLSGSVSTADTNRGGKSVKVTSVESTTLSRIFEDNGISRCDFLKMDCEGAEYEILASATQQIFDRIQCVAMEFHNGRGQEAINALEGAGFEIVSTRNQYGECGLIKARRRYEEQRSSNQCNR